MIDFSDIDQHQNEREDGSVEDPLRMHRTASNEIVFVSGIAGIINEENFIIPSGQGEKPASFLGDAVCVDQAFPCLFSKDICGYKAPQDITISPARYFNQSLLNFNQGFGSDANYICFAILVLYMSNTTYVHQYVLLCTKLNQVHSQQEQLKVILKKQLKCMLEEKIHFHL